MKAARLGAPANLLPRDGSVNYFGRVFSAAESAELFRVLLREVPWKSDELVMFGRRITTRRQVAWYGGAGCSYTYSGVTRQPLPWTPELRALKTRVESLADAAFNSCLLNLYHDGRDGMAWHSDDEKELGRHNTIASVSLGAERKFSFKHRRTGETVSLALEDGSLLVMRGATQLNWQHSLPKSKKVTTARINLTFREIQAR